MLGSPGSKTRSTTRLFSLRAFPARRRAATTFVTTSFSKAGEAAVAFVERYSPSTARGGTMVAASIAVPPMPENPVEVATKTVAGSVGWTRILLIARPVKALVAAMPVTTAGLMGPTRSAEVSALSMR